MSDPNAGKRAAARAAADLVRTNTTIGLGTGSTFAFVIERLAERIRDEGLRIAGVPTSKATADLAAAARIPLREIDDVAGLDLAIDGADEVDPKKCLVKGGGAAHTRERMVAVLAKELVVIVDDSKLVPMLGKGFLLPIEVLPFGWKQTERRIAATGCRPTLRQKNGTTVVTDNGNWVLDCKYDGIPDPGALARTLDCTVGVVDHGLFVGMAGRVIVGDGRGAVRVIT